MVPGTVPASPLVRGVAAVTEAVQVGADAEALRCVVTMSAALDQLVAGDLVAAIAADPGSTGDGRWDALIGGMVERAAHRVGVRTPTWTSGPGRVLDRWWFVSPYRTLHASAFVATPPELAGRGVFIHASSLESV